MRRPAPLPATPDPREEESPARPVSRIGETVETDAAARASARPSSGPEEDPQIEAPTSTRDVWRAARARRKALRAEIRRFTQRSRRRRIAWLTAVGAVLLLVGYQFIIMAMRVGDVSFIAPFRYTALLWAIVIGILFFGDFPDIPVLVGASIIVTSGLYTLYRERVVGRSRVAAESTGPAMAPDGI